MFFYVLFWSAPVLEKNVIFTTLHIFSVQHTGLNKSIKYLLLSKIIFIAKFSYSECSWNMNETTCAKWVGEHCTLVPGSTYPPSWLGADRAHNLLGSIPPAQWDELDSAHAPGYCSELFLPILSPILVGIKITHWIWSELVAITSKSSQPLALLLGTITIEESRNKRFTKSFKTLN